MTDPRPSENDRPEFPMAKHLGLIPGASDRLMIMPNPEDDRTQALKEIAEQLRIGNLIAYATHRNEHTDATGPRDVAPALRSLLGNVDFEIREGLGLS